MWMLYERETRTKRQAFGLALSHADLAGMAWEASALFSWTVPTELGNPRNRVSRVVHQEYGGRTSWRENGIWHIPLPRLRYDRQAGPHIAFTVQPYLVASVIVDNHWPATVVGPVGKLQKTVVPLTVLLAFLKGREMSSFPVLVLEKPWTTWRVEGLKEGQVRYHDRFVEGLRAALARDTVERWLEGFGTQAEDVVPYVVDDLYTLVEDELVQATKSEGGWTYADLEGSLQKPFGYSAADARSLITRVNPSLALPFEEAVRLCLQYADHGRG